MMIEAIILILFLMFCDRVRGGERFGLKTDNTTWYWLGLEIEISTGWGGAIGYAAKFGYGAILGYMISPSEIGLILASSVLWWLGEKPSWRDIFNEISGLVPEDDNLFLRFALRGLIWCVLPACLAWFDINYLLLLFMCLAFPLSAYAGYRWQTWFDEHAFTEIVRPLFLGVFIVTTQFIIS